MNRSKTAVVAMVAVGMAMAIFAWWVRYNRSQQVLAIWGRDAVVAIRDGEKVELLRLSRSSEEGSGETIVLGSEDGNAKSVLTVDKVTDISQTPGLIHARHHLLQEKGFDWDAEPDNCLPRWEVGLRFTHGENVATMLLDFQCNRAYLVQRYAEVNMKPIAASLSKFLSGL
jgi:hypothetical protein